MTWQQRYRVWLAARQSLVLWVTLALGAAILLAPVIRSIDEQTRWSMFGFSPDGARAVLGALAGSMLTFIVFVLSATLIVVQLASGQLTPRVIGIVFAQRRIKITLALFTFAYTYTLSALARVDNHVPELHVGLAVILNLACILGFFLFVEQLAFGLRPGAVMRLVAGRGERVIHDVYPRLHDPGRSEQSTRDRLTSGGDIVTADRTGVLMAFSVGRLVRLAREFGGAIELIPQVGDFIAEGDALIRVATPRPIPPNDLRGCVAIGAERTMEQDPRFVFRILVDIGARALSPGINDPTTAVEAISQIHHLLLSLGRRHLGDGVVSDPDGVRRLVFGTPDWADFVMLALTELRMYGATSLQVVRRLRAMVEHLLAELPEARRPALEKELALLGRAVERAFPDEEDRRRATVADMQGVGGSEY